MKRNLVLASLIVVLVASTASAQVTYQVTTTPTFVINTGRSEVMGSVRITAQNTTNTVASTVEYLFQGVSCDNDTTSGITLSDSAPFTGNAAIANVNNTSAGCVVSVTVPGALGASAGTSFIEIQGVRGRIDFLGGITNTGQNINASLSATPSNSSLFTVPNQGVVGITAVGLEVVSTTAGSVLQCVGTGTNPVLVLQEGFNGAFVQHVVSTAGTLIPANNRPTFGGEENTQIRIEITGLPSGVTLAWPSFVQSDLASAFLGGNTAGGGSRLEEILQSTSGDSVTYEFVTDDQSVSDLNQEQFRFNTTVATTSPNLHADASIGLSATATAAFGTGTIQLRLFPDLASTGEPTSISSAPTGSLDSPRFNDPFRPDPGADFASNVPCRTNLLFPFVANIAGFDTGIAIANTTSDPYGTGAQAGTCTLSGWPAATGTPAVMFTTPSVATGTTFATVLSSSANAAFNGFSGYIIAVCDFQFAHGFAFITDNFGVGAPNTAQGYLALIIPDPVLNAGRIANDASTGATNSGENLGQ